jgi:hypothetical protein
MSLLLWVFVVVVAVNKKIKTRRVKDLFPIKSEST